MKSIRKNLKKKFEAFKKEFEPLYKISSVEAYFALPKSEREKWGLYRKPFALPSELFNKSETGGWGAFERQIRKEYPIQGFLREWLFTTENPVNWFFYRIYRRYRDIKYAIKKFFRPAHPRFRKVYPRHKWMDVHYAVEEINLALLLDFWYEEVVDGLVKWNGDRYHRAVYDFLKKSVYWIEKTRPRLEAQIQAEHKKIHAYYEQGIKKTYEQKYGRINRIEKQIQDKITEIIVKMAKYRPYLWT